MEPHQSLPYTLTTLSHDPQLVATRVDLSEVVRLRSLITVGMTLQIKQGVTTLKHKRKATVVESRSLIITQSLGGTVVSALQDESERGLVMVPVLSVGANEAHSTEQLIALALLRRDEVPAAPEQVRSAPVQAEAPRKRTPKAAPTPAASSEEADQEPPF